MRDFEENIEFIIFIDITQQQEHNTTKNCKKFIAIKLTLITKVVLEVRLQNPLFFSQPLCSNHNEIFHSYSSQNHQNNFIS